MTSGRSLRHPHIVQTAKSKGELKKTFAKKQNKQEIYNIYPKIYERLGKHKKQIKLKTIKLLNLSCYLNNYSF